MTSTEAIIAVTAGLAAVITAATPGYLAWSQSKRNHVAMNSRLDELLAETRKNSRAEGRAEGIAEGKIGVNTP